MGRFDFIKAKHFNYYIAAAAMVCVFDAALQLQDPMFVIFALLLSVFAYVIGKTWQEEEHAMARRHGLLIYSTSCAVLLASSLVLIFGPDAVARFRWLFFGLAVLIGSRIKAG